MGLLNFIFGKSIKIQDEFFGTMLFLEDKKEPSQSYYECRRHFAPTDKIIEIGIVGDISGPTQEQVNFFRRIEKEYSSLAETLTPLVENEFRSWNESFKIVNFQTEFEAVYLWIPSCESKHIVWEISLETDHDRNHTIMITMNDFEPKEILIDG